MAIKVKNLNFKFQDNAVLFKNCNFEIKDNKNTVLLGLNGVGKSTLFKILTNACKAEAEIKNEFKNVFYLPQNVFCPKGINCFDYLASHFFKNGFRWYLINKEKEAIIKALSAVSLFNKKNIEVDKLSGGEFQKLNLALSLISDSDLLLLDEPVSNLDIINQKFLIDTIKSLKTTSVVILHDLNLSYEFGDEFIAITKEGEIIQLNKKDFFTKENLYKIFGAEFNITGEDDKKFIQIL